MNLSQTFDPELHEVGSRASRGQCSHHARDAEEASPCAGEAVVSFQDEEGRWQSGCSLALEQLVEKGAIAPLGQGA
jgi:hypothetical protein